MKRDPDAQTELAADLERVRCCCCGDEIEDGFSIRDEDGNVYCEGCWTP